MPVHYGPVLRQADEPHGPIDVAGLLPPQVRQGRRDPLRPDHELSFTILLAGNIVAGGYLFEAFLGTSYAVGVLIITAAVLAYTIAGGMFSDTYTSVLQLTVALAGAIGLIVYIGMEYGLVIPEGMGPFAFEQLTDPAAGAYVNWATLLALGLGDIVAIDFMQRVFAARSPETAQRACFAGAAGTLIIGLPFAIIALSANDILTAAGVTAEGPVLYALLQNAVPPLLAALVLAGIVAASFSTADGAILGTAAVAARNVLNRPVQVGSHFHFFEANRALKFDRQAAYGMRLNIPAGTAVRFEPGDEREVELVAIGGRRVVRGLNGLTEGALDDPEVKEATLRRTREEGFMEEER